MPSISELLSSPGRCQAYGKKTKGSRIAVDPLSGWIGVEGVDWTASSQSTIPPSPEKEEKLWICPLDGTVLEYPAYLLLTFLPEEEAIALLINLGCPGIDQAVEKTKAR